MKFHEGDEVKALVTHHDSGIHEGQTYVIEFAYDDVPDLDEPLYALARPNFGSSGQEALESQLERTRTWSELAQRKVPTPLDIIKAIPLGWHADFDLNESDISGETRSIEMYGKTAEGLPFGFRMTVEWVREVDY